MLKLMCVASRRSLIGRASPLSTKAAKVPIIAEKYGISRGDFAEVDASDLAMFKDIVGESNVITSESDLEPYNVEWLNTGRGQSRVVLRPWSTEQLSSIMKHCNRRSLAVVPQGGNTGLVGGSVSVFDEIVVSLNRMNQIISLNETSGILTCDSGCVLEALDNAVAEKGLMMPLDLGAKGSCHIGGNLSTNAGGLRLLRYGSLHGSVVGLEAVLADGTVMDCLSEMRKDNTGYDLKQLLIGSEGTLGIITKVNILLAPRPQAVNVAFLGVQSFDEVKEVYKSARKMLGEIISAVEFMEHACLELVTKHLGGEQAISRHPFYLLIETSGSNQTHDEEKLSKFVEFVLGEGLVTDGTIATDGAKIKALWKLRESIAESTRHEGTCYHYDFSLPLDNYYELVEVMKARLGQLPTFVVGYGHIGDGNLHLNITSNGYSEEIQKLIEPFAFDWTSNHNGSISAEHGIGMQKSHYLSHSKSKEAIAMMKKIKASFDPKGILNPYKLFQ